MKTVSILPVLVPFLLPILAGRAAAQLGAPVSSPAALNTNAGVDTAGDSLPRFATDGAGNWVCVWVTKLGPYGVDEDLLAAASADNGATWSAPSPIDPNAAGDGSAYDRSPDVATDGAGNWVAVWTSNNTLAGTIGTDSDILFARSTNNGATWTAPGPLNSNAASDSAADDTAAVVSSGPSTFLVAWSGFLGAGVDRDLLFERSTTGGASFSPRAPLNTNAASDSGDDTGVHLANDGGLGWVAAWSSTDDLGGTIGTDADILCARSADGGLSWTAPASLKTTAGSDGSAADAWPSIETDRLGNWVCVWMSTDTLSGTIGNDYDVLGSRSENNGATWTAAIPVNTNAASDSGPDWFPRVATDRDGNWIAVWESQDTLGGTIGTDWDVLAAKSTIAGAGWNAPDLLNTNAASDAGHDMAPAIATDHAGRFLAVWHSSDSLGGTVGNDEDIFVASFDLEQTTATGFCYGDGSAGACPCNNPTPVGAREGCANTSGFGARLLATGNPYAQNNTLTLHVSQLPGSVTHIYIQGSASAVPGFLFGDGRRCVSGSLKRLAVYSGMGTSSSAGYATGLDLAAAGQVLPGSTYSYQVWYRNGTSTLCSPANTFNISGGLRVLWYP